MIIAKEHKALLNGTRLDFVEMEDGQMHFIFLNPNDPSYVEPDNSDENQSSSNNAG